MTRIVVLLHEHAGRRLPSAHRIWPIADVWRAQGLEVVPHWGPKRGVDADLVINHIDTTIVSETYLRVLDRYALVLNRRAVDVSKRVVSSNLVSQDDGWAGPVIVKTDRNYGGLPDIRLRSGPRRALRRLFPRSRGLSRTTTLDPRAYPIFDTADAVPPGVFSNPSLVVERFLPERDGPMYCLRTYSFLGDRHISVLRTSANPIVKSDPGDLLTPVEVPQAILEARRRLGFDYGKFDYVVHGGEVVLLDVSRTPGFRKTGISAEGRARCALLAEGLRVWLPQGAAIR